MFQLALDLTASIIVVIVVGGQNTQRVNRLSIHFEVSFVTLAVFTLARGGRTGTLNIRERMMKGDGNHDASKSREVEDANFRVKWLLAK